MSKRPKLVQPKAVAELSRADFLTWMISKQLIPAMEAADPGSVAYTQLSRQVATLHKELFEIRLAEARAGQTATDFEQLTPEEQQAVIEQTFRSWPEQHLMLAISELQTRHPGRIRVLIEGQEGAA
jgi:hypothetical protein